MKRGRKVQFTPEEIVVRKRQRNYAVYVQKKTLPEYVRLEEAKKQERVKIKESQAKIKTLIKQQQSIKIIKKPNLIKKITNGECKSVKEFANKYNIKINKVNYIIYRLRAKGKEITLPMILEKIKKNKKIS
jgi:hypothetical protein